MVDQDKLERLCEEAEAALADDDGDEAIERIDEALALAPKDIRALLIKSEALFHVEAREDAEETIEEAVAAGAKDARALAQAANLLADWMAEDHTAVQRSLEILNLADKAARAAVEDPMLPSDISWLRGRSYALLDELEKALESFEQAFALAGEAAEDDLLTELALARFEMRQFDAAAKLVERVLKHTPNHPDAHHYLGLLAERRDDWNAAEQHFARARKLDPDAYPEHVHLTTEEFDTAVEAALAKVPEEVKAALANVVIAVERMPKLDDIAGPPALSPLSLGMFRGPVGPDAEAARTVNQLPSEILLYQTNLERYAATREDLIDQIEATLLHEIGHFVGWDEDDLYERGLH